MYCGQSGYFMNKPHIMQMNNERIPPPSPNSDSQNGTRKRWIDEAEEDLNITETRN
jgi:hypothetical protein